MLGKSDECSTRSLVEVTCGRRAEPLTPRAPAPSQRATYNNDLKILLGTPLCLSVTVKVPILRSTHTSTPSYPPINSIQSCFLLFGNGKPNPNSQEQSPGELLASPKLTRTPPRYSLLSCTMEFQVNLSNFVCLVSYHVLCFFLMLLLVLFYYIIIF